MCVVSEQQLVMEVVAVDGGRTLTLNSLLQHGQTVGDLSLQLIDLEGSVVRGSDRRQTEEDMRINI